MADRKLNKSQSIIDFAVALIAIALLAVGIVRMWVWFNANYAKRQVGYQQGRLLAAGRNRPIKTSEYSQATGIGADDTHRTQGFKPLDLTEDWVFKGKASGRVGGGGAVPVISVAMDCKPQVELLVSAYDEQIIALCGSDKDCNLCTADCGGTVTTDTSRPPSGRVYTPTGSRTTTTDTTAPGGTRRRITWTSTSTRRGGTTGTTNTTSTTGGGDCGEACELRNQANSLRDGADKLNKGLARWFGGKKAAKELRDAADTMDAEAKKFEDAANSVTGKISALPGCCDKTTTEDQQACLNQIQEQINELWNSLNDDA